MQRNRITRLVIATLFLSGILSSSSAQDITSSLDSIFRKMHEEKKFYGNVLVADHGKVIYQATLGKANHATGKDLDSESIFELASVSKQFTAMGIMLLKKQGKLQYEDSLRKFFPGLPYQNITVRQLLQHTSGLPDYMELFENHWDATKIATNKDIIELLSKEKPPVLFKPGEKWEYSNTGYTLLASIVEQVSGMGFGKYLHENIFKPLGMKRTMVFRRRYEKYLPENYALGYGWDKAKGEYILPDSVKDIGRMVYTLDGIVGDGTVNSTINDLLKWDQALYTEKLMSRADLDEAFAPAKLNDGKTFNYGFGWSLSKSFGGLAMSHSGGWPGYNTYIERHPETRKLIIFLRNHETGTSVPLQAVRKIIYGIKDTVSVAKAMDSISLKEYRGVFELVPGFTITMTTEGDRIFTQATGQDKFEIFNEGPDKFFLKVVEAKLKFVRDKEGKITGFILYQNGQEVEGKKIEGE